MLSLMACKSDQEIQDDETKEVAIDALSSGMADLMINGLITEEQSNSISDTYSTLSKADINKGLRYAEYIYALSKDESLTKEDVKLRLEEYGNHDSMNDFLSEVIDYSSFDYKLRNSEYAMKVQITSIETEEVEGAFEKKADEYSVPEKVSGYLLSVHYELTNPHDKELMIPIPNYASITSTRDEFFSGSTVYNRDCQCDIDNSTEMTDEKGRKLYEIRDGECGSSHYCMIFQPGETKSFIINFTDPIYSEVKRLVFKSFNLEWDSPESTSPRDRGIIIDIDKKAVVGEKLY